jgi:hypothetical protein
MQRRKQNKEWWDSIKCTPAVGRSSYERQYKKTKKHGVLKKNKKKNT